MPLRCLIFGHAWHNDHHYATYIEHDEPCERRDCPATRNPAPEPVVSVEAIRLAAVVLDRRSLADKIHAHRFDRTSVDSFYAGMRYAEQLVKEEA